MRISDWSSDVCSSDLVGDALFEILDRRRVGPGPAVEGLRAWRQVQQDRHPEIGHDHADGDELAEQVGINREHLLHRCLVGASPDPTAGQRGHAAPGPPSYRGRKAYAHRPYRHHHTANRTPTCKETR